MGGRAVISIGLFTKHITLSDSCHSSCRHPGMERALTVEFPQSYSIWGVFVRTRRPQEIACGLLSQDERTTKSESCEWRGGWEGQAEVRCVIPGDAISLLKMGIERAQDLTV
jgi:hypothetical protein